MNKSLETLVNGEDNDLGLPFLLVTVLFPVTTH